MARSILHKNVRELAASAKKTSQRNKAIESSHVSTTNSLHTASDDKKPTITDRSPSDAKKFDKSSAGKMQNNETRRNNGSILTVFT